MTIKRIIMDIDDKLHKRIKDCSIRDDRTLNSTIKKVLSAGIGIIETRVQSYDDNQTINQEQREITQYGRALTTDERFYFKQNPSNTLTDYAQFLVVTGHKPVTFIEPDNSLNQIAQPNSLSNIGKMTEEQREELLKKEF